MGRMILLEGLGVILLLIIIAFGTTKVIERWTRADLPKEENQNSTKEDNQNTKPELE